MSRKKHETRKSNFEGSGSVESLLVEVVDETLKEILGKDTTEVIHVCTGF